MKLLHVMLFLAATSVVACSTEPCGNPGEFGVILEIRDETGAPVAVGTTVTASQGDYTETLGDIDELSVAGLVDRSGEFQLTISRPGYLTVERAVELSDDCEATPEVIEINLQPE